MDKKIKKAQIGVHSLREQLIVDSLEIIQGKENLPLAADRQQSIRNRKRVCAIQRKLKALDRLADAAEAKNAMKKKFYNRLLALKLRKAVAMEREAVAMEREAVAMEREAAAMERIAAALQKLL